MNAGAMQGKVDVLAVLRRVSRHVPNEDFVEFDDALDAVAELIEASSRVASHRSRSASQIDADWDRLRAALARIEGTKQ